MNLRVAHKTQWLRGVFAIFSQDLELRQRFRAAWPAYALRWALIMLNEFLPEGWQKRLRSFVGKRSALLLNKAKHI